MCCEWLIKPHPCPLYSNLIKIKVRFRSPSEIAKKSWRIPSLGNTQVSCA